MTDGYRALGRLVAELAAYLAEQGVARAADIVGEAADAVQTYEAAGRALAGEGAWRRFAAGAAAAHRDERR
jgi:hypothetical protein